MASPTAPHSPSSMNSWKISWSSPDKIHPSPPHWISYNKEGKAVYGRRLTKVELSKENTKIAQMIEKLRTGRIGHNITDLQKPMSEVEVKELLYEKFSGTKFDKDELLNFIEYLNSINRISSETYNKIKTDYSTLCDKASNMCSGVIDNFKKAFCCGKKKVEGGRKKKTRKKRKKKKVKNKRLLKTIRKRNKLRLNVQRKNCSIKKQKVKKNKHLKNKKKIMRLTRKLCKAKRDVKKLMNQIGILKVKNNKALN